MFQYQKELEIKALHFRQLWLKVEEDVHKKNIEKHDKEALASSSTTRDEKSKDKAKFFLKALRNPNLPPH